jgi:hypothetical protein
MDGVAQTKLIPRFASQPAGASREFVELKIENRHGYWIAGRLVYP